MALTVSERELLVLLLAQPLEASALRRPAEALLRAPDVVVVEPARLSYGALGRVPAAVSESIAILQAKRLELPGTPRAVALLHPLQYPLARAVVALNPGSELWYAGRVPDAARARARRRLELLHDQATARATHTLEPDEIMSLWERLDA